MPSTGHLLRKTAGPTVTDIESSDSQRHARPLRHAQYWTDRRELALAGGARLPEVTVCYETYGALNEARDNAVLICHAISGDSHVARHDDDDDPGWWEILVGPGKPIDTERYFVICSNALGGCRGTTGPNFTDPQTGRPYGADFPVVTVGDMVEVQKRLVEHLGIETLRAVVGGSLGGLQAVEWAIQAPLRLWGCVPVAAAPRLSSQGIAFDVVGRNAIRHDRNFNGGQYYDGDAPEAGLALARMLAHITYLSDESMRHKFDPTRLEPRAVDSAFESMFSVGSYLAHQGDKFVERFDANSYLTLSTAMDLFDLGDSPQALRQSLGATACHWLFLSFSTDWLYPPQASRQLVDALVAQTKPVSYCNIDSTAGHDSFLLPESMELGGQMIGAFLAHVGRDPTPARPQPAKTSEATNIFDAMRVQHETVLDLVPPHASVVDLGCGHGELMDLLRTTGRGPLLGIERSQTAVAECVGRGLAVIHADIENGLGSIADESYDVAILSQTLQSIADVAGVLDELLRVASKGIVSFPNFAYKPMREMFLNEGRVPKAKGFYSYEWYDTPNRRFPSILDFLELCDARSIRVADAIYLESQSGRRITEDPNLNADVAIVSLAR